MHVHLIIITHCPHQAIVPNQLVRASSTGILCTMQLYCAQNLFHNPIIELTNLICLRVCSTWKSCMHNSQSQATSHTAWEYKHYEYKNVGSSDSSLLLLWLHDLRLAGCCLTACYGKFHHRHHLGGWQPCYLQSLVKSWRSCFKTRQRMMTGSDAQEAENEAEGQPCLTMCSGD